MGHIALARIKNSQRRLNGKFFAVIGIVTGWLSLAIMCICAIGIAVGIAALPASWTASHEMKNEAALQTAKSLQVGLENYYKKYESYPISEGDKMRKRAIF